MSNDEQVEMDGALAEYRENLRGGTKPDECWTVGAPTAGQFGWQGQSIGFPNRGVESHDVVG